jgi:hypothetical protein
MLMNFHARHGRYNALANLYTAGTRGWTCGRAGDRVLYSGFKLQIWRFEIAWWEIIPQIPAAPTS